VRQAAKRTPRACAGAGNGAHAHVAPGVRIGAIANDGRRDQDRCDLEYDPDTAVVSSQEVSPAPSPPSPDMSATLAGGRGGRAAGSCSKSSKVCTGQQGGRAGPGGEAGAGAQATPDGREAGRGEGGHNAAVFAQLEFAAGPVLQGRSGMVTRAQAKQCAAAGAGAEEGSERRAGTLKAGAEAGQQAGAGLGAVVEFAAGGRVGAAPCQHTGEERTPQSGSKECTREIGSGARAHGRMARPDSSPMGAGRVMAHSSAHGSATTAEGAQATQAARKIKISKPFL
jgi:hypothetical protein